MEFTNFNLDSLHQDERFDLWKESIQVLFEVDRSQECEDDFHAEMSVSRFGGLLLANTASSAQAFNRSKQLINRDGLDCCMLQVYQKGETCGHWGTRSTSRVRSGDVFFLDMTQPVESQATEFSNLTLVIPRHMLTLGLGVTERFHGATLSGQSAMGHLLREHLQNLWAVARTVNSIEASAIGQALVDTVSTYFSAAPAPETPYLPGVAISLRETIRNHIDQNLALPDMSIEYLVRRFNVSRSYLGLLFKPLGGLSYYIRDRRLRRAYMLLKRSDQSGRNVGDIATSLGFSSPALFSRVFRQAFGISPVDARDAKLSVKFDAVPQQTLTVERRYEDWVRELTVFKNNNEHTFEVGASA